MSAPIARLVLADVVGSVNDVLSFAAVVTAAVAGASRYAAVLLGADRDGVERATARGFYLGVLVSAILFVLSGLGE